MLIVVVRYRAIHEADPNTWACSSETRMTLPDISGGEFEVIYTNCDTVAKDESISVYVSARSWVAKLLAKKTLLFRYDPAISNSPLPSIKPSGQNRILISIPRVSSISFQSRKWGAIEVDYEIGKIDYPEPGESRSSANLHADRPTICHHRLGRHGKANLHQPAKLL